MNSLADCRIELNFFERGLCVERWSHAVTPETTPEQLIEVGRRYLLRFWKEAENGSLTPRSESAEEKVTPNEVVIRAPDGRAVYRRTIFDEKIDHWFRSTPGAHRLVS